jgi:hypothetical protein
MWSLKRPSKPARLHLQSVHYEEEEEVRGGAVGHVHLPVGPSSCWSISTPCSRKFRPEKSHNLERIAWSLPHAPASSGPWRLAPRAALTKPSSTAFIRAPQGVLGGVRRRRRSSAPSPPRPISFVWLGSVYSLPQCLPARAGRRARRSRTRLGGDLLWVDREERG